MRNLFGCFEPFWYFLITARDGSGRGFERAAYDPLALWLSFIVIADFHLIF